ncbi:hypothetical protein A6041_05080 [[Haemophilus] ducreyi]|uniref:DUF4870 family protein n=1 Tax=Haemophilus ducreyi TaxID=730 RepID=UPI0007CE072E|nr:hypothetical protein [[Haemophilus] ducreyi]ANF61699.1 hypothetical protein A6037_02530 [[Haemophilus] ducreyi]ANF67948.1 hypothetical protein A6041_05080 [[Haemophilus] ducreyi]ANF69491.1 hypothetical protein A6042_06025 [[Haemophilus] ducreyi]
MNDPFLLNSDDDAKRKMMYLIYALFGLGIIFGGIPTIAGVILAYIKRDKMIGTLYYDHLRFLIKTFWGTVILCGLGFLLTIVFIGVFLIWAVGIWYIFRIIYGAARFFDNKPVTPTGWFM